MIRRGTTPKIVITLENLDFSKVKTICLTLRQDYYVINKFNEDLSIDAENKTISVKLTQEETLGFIQGTNFKAQVRVVLESGLALASVVVHDRVEGVLKEGVIE